jgi:hypothetical protein
MGKHALRLWISAVLLGGLTAGCGIIGGAFEEPGPEENPTVRASGVPAETQAYLDFSATLTQAASGPTAAPTFTQMPGLPAGCINALTITADNLNQTLCVGGPVYIASLSHGTYVVDFNQDPKSFYMVGYDWQGTLVIHPGDCVYAQGKIVKVGPDIVMGITPGAFHLCPPTP